MNDEVLRRELRRISIEANHRCFGCGFEHNCGIHGCAIVREALERLEEYRELGPIDHLRELTQAEKDGRLVVLPCKVGDTVYRVLTTRDNDPIITEIKIKNLGQAVDLIGRIGEKRMLVSWYLTRGEAEAALKKREAENEPD